MMSHRVWIPGSVPGCSFMEETPLKITHTPSFTDFTNPPFKVWFLKPINTLFLKNSLNLGEKFKGLGYCQYLFGQCVSIIINKKGNSSVFFFFEGPGLWDVTVTPGGKQRWKSMKNFCILKRIILLHNIFNIILLIICSNGQSPFVQGVHVLHIYECEHSYKNYQHQYLQILPVIKNGLVRRFLQQPNFLALRAKC